MWLITGFVVWIVLDLCIVVVFSKLPLKEQPR